MSEENGPKGKQIGVVSHYFGEIGVAAIDLMGKVKVGDSLRIKGSTTDFEQAIDSMQIEKESVEKAGRGKSIGIKVGDKVRVGDKVYKI